MIVGDAAKAQVAGGPPCANSRAQCKGTADGNYQSCLGGCANGDTACSNTCNNNKISAYSECDSQYNACITGEADVCASRLGSCSGGHNTETCTFTASQEICICSCKCPTSPPNCPRAECQDNGQWFCNSPIVIDPTGEGFFLTDVVHGVYFDLWATGQPARFSWTDAAHGNAWLVLDRNSNGRIDNGSEMFGSATPQPPVTKPGEVPNGFNALSVYDDVAAGGNDDGLIDRHDSIYDQLKLWRDTNHNGISEASELSSLPDSNIKRIDLDYRNSNYVDAFGNAYRLKARVWDMAGHQGRQFAYDVFLLTAQ